ncbi:type II toxin-antitoxin system VapC family toxin [Nitrospira sp. Kam-Ns4a]
MRPAWAYFDTSALLKRYVRADTSAQARALLRRHRLLSSAVFPVELMSALSRRHRAGHLTDRHFQAIIARLRQDRAYWELVEVSPQVLAQAEDLVRTLDLRTLDAIHVASVMTVQVASGIRIPLVTADAQQRKAAELVRLSILWVG